MPELEPKKNQKTLMSDTPEMLESLRHQSRVQKFMQGKVLVGGSHLYRFGVLTRLFNRAPLYIYDHPDLAEKYPTAFTDGQAVWFNRFFWEELRDAELSAIQDGKDEIGHNIVPVLLHELQHIARQHTTRSTLRDVIKTEFDGFLMNLAMDSLINGAILTEFSHYAKKHHSNIPSAYPTLRLGKEFIQTAVGLGSKEMRFFYNCDMDEPKDYNKVPKNKKAAAFKEYMKKVYEYLHWENTYNMTELEIFNHLKKMLKDEPDLNESDFQEQKSGPSKGKIKITGINKGSGQNSNSKGGMPGGDFGEIEGEISLGGGSGSGGHPDDEVEVELGEGVSIEDILDELGKDAEVGSHSVNPLDLHDDLKKAGLDNVIQKAGVAKNEKDAANQAARAQAGVIDDTAQEIEQTQSSGFAPGKALTDGINQRIKRLNEPKLNFTGELRQVSEEIGNGNTLVENDYPNELYSLDGDMLGLEGGLPIYEEQLVASKKHSVLMVLVDTSGSVDDGMLKRFLSEVIGMAEYLEGSDGRIILCPADTVIRDNTITEITPQTALKQAKEGLLIGGRGGTSFENALIQTGEMIKKQFDDNPATEESVDALFYYTDGYDCAPKHKPHDSLPDTMYFITDNIAQADSLRESVNNYALVAHIDDGVEIDLEEETNINPGPAMSA